MKKFFTLFMMFILQSICYITYAKETEEILAYCNEEMQSTGFGSSKDINIEAGIFLPQITNYEGNHITKVRIGLKSRVSNLKIFIRESLEENPIYIQNVGSLNEGWNEITLSQRFDITDKPLYIGYSCSLKGGAYELGLSTNESCPNSFFMNAGNGFKDMSEKDYKPLSLKVVIAGNNFIYDKAQINNVNHTYARPEEQIPVIFNIKNLGMNNVTSMEAEISIEGTSQKLQVKLDNISIARKETLYGQSLDFKPLQVGVYNVKCKIFKVNGKEQNTETVFSQRIYVLDSSMVKKPVCEKTTGNTCSYCPRGIVAFEQMFDKYPETFIGISADCFSQMDPLYINDYLPLIQRYSGTAPAFVVDRNMVSKDFESLDRDYQKACKQLTWAELNISASKESYKDKNIDVTVNTTFNIDQSDPHYRLILVAIEHKVESYQLNDYADNKYGEMGGWEKLPSRVDTLFNEVARRIINFDGIENSIPQSISKGKKYEFKYKMDIPTVSNIENAEIIAMLLNTENGQIINSDKVKLESGSGISTPKYENPEYFISNGNICLRFKNEASRSVFIYSIDGQKVSEISCISTSLQIPTDDMQGIYIICMYENDNITGRIKVLL